MPVFLAGKLLTAWILIFLVCLVALVCGFAYLSIDFATLPLALLWSACAGTALLAGMMLIQLLAASQRAGNIVTMALMFPLMMVGGAFFPIEAMPGWMAAMGRLTPNGWMLSRLKDIIFHQTDPASVALSFAALLAGLLLISLLGAWRLRRGFAQG